MNVSINWYTNSVLNFSVDYNASYANGTFFDAVLANGNTTKGQNWSCGMRLFDGQLYSNWVNTTNLTILNTPPAVTLSDPPDASSTTNRTPTFNWTGSDDDGDSMTYEFNISLVASSLCSEPDRYVTGINGSNYTLTSDLACLYDNGDHYIWSARAYDSSLYGSWASYWQINISSLVAISLINDSIDFGSLSLHGYANTTENSPLPFLLQNDGNALLNISINASNLWTSAANPSNYYKFKIDNSSEAGAFDWAQSITNFTNMPNSATLLKCISRLNYTDSKDTAEIDLYVQVPPNEMPGARNSTVTFMAVLGE
jgi:hypothetical protein